MTRDEDCADESGSLDPLVISPFALRKGEKVINPRHSDFFRD
jgi:hypothetical protein